MKKDEDIPVTNPEISAMPDTDIKTIFLGGIFLMTFMVLLHEAKEILIPIVLAFMLKLALQPVVRRLSKLGLPQTMVSFLVISLLIGLLAILANALSDPAATLLKKIPEGFNKVRTEFSTISKSVKQTQKVIGQAEDLTKNTSPKVIPVAIEGNSLSDKVFTGTKALITQLLTTIVVLFFLMVSGDTFLRRLVEILPRFKDKRQAVDISQNIEQDISLYNSSF